MRATTVASHGEFNIQDLTRYCPFCPAFCMVLTHIAPRGPLYHSAAPWHRHHRGSPARTGPTTPSRAGLGGLETPVERTPGPPYIPLARLGMERPVRRIPQGFELEGQLLRFLGR